MSVLPSPRPYQAVWIMRFVEIILVVAVLGIAASSVSDFSASEGCHPPSKLGWHIACAVITLPLLIYFIFSSGPKRWSQLVPFSPWVQIAIDAVLVIFWIAAAASAKYSCTDLCNACSGLRDFYDSYYVTYQGSACICYQTFAKRSTPASPLFGPSPLGGELQRRAGLNTGSSGSKAASKAGKMGAKIGLDAILVVLFAISLAATVWWVIKARRARSAPAAGYDPGKAVAGENINMSNPPIRNPEGP